MRDPVLISTVTARPGDRLTVRLSIRIWARCEIEGVDLDLGILSGMDKTDVAVRHHGLDFQPAIARYDDEQGLRRGDDAADRMDRELLYHAVHGSGQQLKSGLLLGLDQVLGEPVGLLLGLDQFVG